jgi:3',5'-cyclic AMP phosphodiesterase CpdA
MTITNTWAVVQMDAYPEEDGETDVVFNVHWTLTGTDDTYSGYVYGTQGVSIDPDAPFTPYADLTEAQVIGWVQDALGEEQVAVYEASVAQQIADAKNPPVVSPALPW